jgi:hypothetical protein
MGLLYLEHLNFKTKIDVLLTDDFFMNSLQE